MVQIIVHVLLQTYFDFHWDSCFGWTLHVRIENTALAVADNQVITIFIFSYALGRHLCEVQTMGTA
jgi:hypothetical protein